MEQKIKEIISGYTKIPASQIELSTIINRSAVSSSIILHRMYAQLANEGFVVTDYQTVKTFADLLRALPSKGNSEPSSEIIISSSNTFVDQNYGNTASGIGIDIEHINKMPIVNDYRENAFYTMNFSASEIAYCILKPDPLSSFAGLFAAKEAIVKADNWYKNKSFNQIIIDHLPDGKPVHAVFQISISHTNDLAIAVAITTAVTTLSTSSNQPVFSKSNFSFLIAVIAMAAFLIAVLALVIIFLK